PLFHRAGERADESGHRDAARQAAVPRVHGAGDGQQGQRAQREARVGLPGSGGGGAAPRLPAGDDRRARGRTTGGADLTPWLIPVGGFLGAGKTSLLIAAGGRLRERGHKVAILTNDQAAGLVDTAAARRM